MPVTPLTMPAMKKVAAIAASSAGEPPFTAPGAPA
jgi:hypothetical protein